MDTPPRQDINNLRSRLNSKEMLQNMLYFDKNKSHVVFCLKTKNKTKNYMGFSFYQNIANFEVFLWNLKLSANHFIFGGVLELGIRYCNEFHFIAIENQ